IGSRPLVDRQDDAALLAGARHSLRLRGRGHRHFSSAFLGPCLWPVAAPMGSDFIAAFIGRPLPDGPLWLLACLGYVAAVRGWKCCLPPAAATGQDDRCLFAQPQDVLVVEPYRGIHFSACIASGSCIDRPMAQEAADDLVLTRSRAKVEISVK